MVHFLPYLLCYLLANEGKQGGLQAKRNEDENRQKEDSKHVIFCIAEVGGDA